MDLTISPEEGLIAPEQLKKLMLTPKNTTLFKNPPDTIVIHYTAGRSAASSAEWLWRSDVKASAHVVIGKEGEIYQIVPFTNIAWHAGESAYGGRRSFNNFSIGIELDNPGYLTRAGSQYIAPFGARYEANQVIEATHDNESSPRFWHTYSQAQIEACEDLCWALMKAYPSINQILGHEEISPGRKQDPGPAFPLQTFRARILQHDRASDADEIIPLVNEGRVVVDKLNIRQGAGTVYEKIAKPLPLNQKVAILGERDGWYRVKVEVEGWVNKAYVSSQS